MFKAIKYFYIWTFFGNILLINTQNSRPAGSGDICKPENEFLKCKPKQTFQQCRMNLCLCPEELEGLQEIDIYSIQIDWSESNDKCVFIEKSLCFLDSSDKIPCSSPNYSCQYTDRVTNFHPKYGTCVKSIEIPSTTENGVGLTKSSILILCNFIILLLLLDN